MMYLILLLGGSSERTKSEKPKQFIKIKDKEIFEYSLRTFDECYFFDKFILVTPKDGVSHVSQILKSNKIKHSYRIIEGGSTRQQSVFNALNFIEGTPNDYVFIHDAARPLISKNDCLKLYKETLNFDAISLCSPLKSSICEINNSQFVEKSLKRENFVQLETPQVFKFGIIYSAHLFAKQKNILNYTDDTSMIDASKTKIKLVFSENDNFKITTNGDIKAFRAIIEEANVQK